jgi:hypothetical protein
MLAIDHRIIDFPISGVQREMAEFYSDGLADVRHRVKPARLPLVNHSFREATYREQAIRSESFTELFWF